MPDPLNPYAEWLGLAASITRPNHYELLGLQHFEADPQAIEAAAGAQRAKLRGAEPGYRPELWRKLADEIENARQCLTDPAQRQRYEAALRQGYGATGPVAGGGSTDEPAAPAGRNVMPPGKNLLPPKRSNESSFPPTITSDADQPPAGRNVMPPGRNVMPPCPSPTSAPLPAASQQRILQQAAPAAAAGPAAPWSPPAPAQPTMPVAAQPSGWPGAPQQPTMPGTYPPSPQTGFPPAPLPAAPLPAAPGYPGGLRMPGAPGFPTPGAYPGASSYPPTQGPGMPGYPAQLGYPSMPGPAMPGYPAPSGYPPAGYPAPQGYPQPQGYAPRQGYPPPQGFPQLGYAAPGVPGGAPPPGFGTPPAPVSPVPAAPTPAPNAGGFFDSLMEEKSSPLDELGLSGPAAAAPEPGWAAAPPQPAAPPFGPPLGYGSGPTGGHFAAPQMAPLSVPEVHSPESHLPDSHLPESGPREATMPDLDSLSQRGPSRRYASHRQSNSPAVLIGAAVGVLILAGIGVAIVMNNRHNNDRVADTSNGNGDGADVSPSKNTSPPVAPSGTVHPEKSPDKSSNPGHDTKPGPQTIVPPVQPIQPKPEPPKPEPPKPEQPKPEVPKPEPPKPEPPKPAPVAPKPPEVDRVTLIKLRQLLADARTKLGERSVPQAQQLIAEAGKLATTPELQDAVHRNETLAKYVEEFWGAVRDAIKGLNPTDEIDVGTSKVVLVAKEPDGRGLTIHVAGQNRQFTLQKLPNGLAIALAERWLDPKKPENKVFIGAFYAVDPKTDRDDAKRIWNEAATAGVDAVNELLPLLEPDPPLPPEPTQTDTSPSPKSPVPAVKGKNGPTQVASTARPTATATSVTPAPATPTPALPVDNSALAPVPEEKTLEKAERKVKNQFDDGYLDATTDAKRSALAKRLLAAVDQTDDPAQRYVLCREARDLAALGGAPAIMIDAIDQMGKQFRIDPLAMKADTLANYPPASLTAGRETVRVELALIDDAQTAKRTAVAAKLAHLAVDAAKASQNSSLLKQAADKLAEVEPK